MSAVNDVSDVGSVMSLCHLCIFEKVARKSLP